jgi:hypothetical protein
MLQQADDRAATRLEALEHSEDLAVYPKPFTAGCERYSGGERKGGSGIGGTWFEVR